MAKEKKKQISLGALILITIGVIALLERRLPGFSFGPLVLIALGIGMLFKSLAE